jgi:hypothetical protein
LPFVNLPNQGMRKMNLSAMKIWVWVGMGQTPQKAMKSVFCALPVVAIARWILVLKFLFDGSWWRAKQKESCYSDRQLHMVKRHLFPHL